MISTVQSSQQSALILFCFVFSIQSISGGWSKKKKRQNRKIRFHGIIGFDWLSA